MKTINVGDLNGTEMQDLLRAYFDKYGQELATQVLTPPVLSPEQTVRNLFRLDPISSIDPRLINGLIAMTANQEDADTIFLDIYKRHDKRELKPETITNKNEFVYVALKMLNSVEFAFNIVDRNLGFANRQEKEAQMITNISERLDAKKSALLSIVEGTRFDLTQAKTFLQELEAVDADIEVLASRNNDADEMAYEKFTPPTSAADDDNLYEPFKPGN